MTVSLLTDFFSICEMDSRSFQHGFQYNFLQCGDGGVPAATNTMVPDLLAGNTVNMVPGAAQTPSAVMPPPPSAPLTSMAHTIVTIPTMRSTGATSSEGESSFNDSGYFSPQATSFTGLASHARGVDPAVQGVPFSNSPRGHSSVVGNLVATARPGWQEDFPNINDEWDNNFINNFEENLFGFDATDLTNMVEGILGSPFKSPVGSPFKSPRPGRSAASGLGLSPFNNLSTSNIMLAGMRKSPGQTGGSPYRKLFSTPSPIKGLNSHTRTSPSTRQRRLILQSPSHRPDSLSESLLDLPSFLDDIQEECEQDDLGVMPFQRTNSLGFSPSGGRPASPPFESLYSEGTLPLHQPLAFGDSPLQSTPSATSTHKLQEIDNITPVRQRKREKREGMYVLTASPPKHEGYKLRSSPSTHKSPARVTQSRISVTRHSQYLTSLNSKDALRFVRARFKEVLDKATADAVVREKRLQSKIRKANTRKRQFAEMSQDSCQSTSENTGAALPSSVVDPDFTRLQSHSQGGKRRQEILPKPTTDWPRKQPCKIAPKKRRRWLVPQCEWLVAITADESSVLIHWLLL